jgi:hypothetical protein
MMLVSCCLKLRDPVKGEPHQFIYFCCSYAIKKKDEIERVAKANR